MSLVREIEIYPLASIKGGMAEFYTPQASSRDDAGANSRGND